MFIKPDEIEKQSMRIISEGLGGDIYGDGRDSVLKRVIHTTADFDYAKSLTFSDGVIEKVLDSLKSGAYILTDTNMARAGINKAAAKRLGLTVNCFMADEDVAAEARARGVTRAVVSMEKACGIKGRLIIAVGNAPTALIRIKELTDEGKLNPDAVIGVPVGFVNVVEAKEFIVESGIPHIVARGNKGGSNVAAAIVNALMYMLR